MPTLLKAIKRFNTIPIKISMSFFAEIEKFILKFIWILKGPQIVKTILKKEQGCKTQTLSFQNILHRIIKTMW